MSYIDWFAASDIYAGTTLRDNACPQNNNMSLKNSNDPEAVVANRKALMKELNFDLDHCVFAHQTHSNHIQKITKDDLGKGAYHDEDAISDCDGLYTRERNILLGVFSADCVPILIWDKEQHIIAAIHAGWRGTVSEITKKMLNTLIYEEDCNPNELYCYIGPAIDFFSFEVDQDVVDEVKKISFPTDKFSMKKAYGKYLVDNKRLNMQMMLDAGIPDLNIFMHDGDTFTNEEDYFSYRRDAKNHCHLTFILQK